VNCRIEAHLKMNQIKTKENDIINVSIVNRDSHVNQRWNSDILQYISCLFRQWLMPLFWLVQSLPHSSWCRCKNKCHNHPRYYPHWVQTYRNQLQKYPQSHAKTTNNAN